MNVLIASKRLLLAGVALTCLAVTPLQAAPILVNGGFESGLAGWTRVDALGSDGTFFLQTGSTSPVNAFTVPAPPEGSFAAMSDAQGPGTHILYQDIVIPSVVNDATVSFSLFVNNLAGDFFTPATLDFSTAALNQRARVDIMLASADPFSLNVLLNLFETAVGDPPVSGYSTHTTDITSLLAAYAGQTLRLRFVDVNNVFIQNIGVDAVNIDVNSRSVPEPGILMLLAAGVATAAFRRRRHHSA